MNLDFIQIYYDESQKKELYSFARPYFNNTLSDFFENDVIKTLVPDSTASYIGVCSWRLKEKRQSGLCPMILNIYGNDDLREEKILGSEADVINLRPFSQGHKMLANAAMWHGGEKHNFAWENAIEELKKVIHIPDEVETPIYENAFVTRRDIYNNYVCNYLSPVIDYMDNNTIFFADSGYAEKKERTDMAGVKRYREKTGRQDYPIAPFILERLFSIWINGQKLKIVNL